MFKIYFVPLIIEQLTNKSQSTVNVAFADDAKLGSQIGVEPKTMARSMSEE